MAMAIGIVRAHAHRQQLQAVARRDLGGQREMRRRRFVGRRNAHQPVDRQPISVAAPRQKRIGILRQHAGLLRLGAGVDLDEQQRPAALLGDFLRQRLAQARPVDRMDGVEQRHRLLAPCSTATARSCAARGPACARAAPAISPWPPARGSRRTPFGRRRSPARWRRRQTSSTPPPASRVAGSRLASRQARSISWRTAVKSGAGGLRAHGSMHNTAPHRRQNAQDPAMPGFVDRVRLECRQAALFHCA